MRRGVHQGESQIALGAWEDTQGDQGGSKTGERVNSGVPKLQYCTRVSITNDKQARALHEPAQYLRKIPIKYWPNGELNRTQPGKQHPQQNKSSYTAGEKARTMRLIWKAKAKIKYNRRGKSNHDTHIIQSKKVPFF